MWQNGLREGPAPDQRERSSRRQKIREKVVHLGPSLGRKMLFIGSEGDSCTKAPLGAEDGEGTAADGLMRLFMPSQLA